MHVSDELIKKIVSKPTPVIIAISGFGGSGKSTFAETLSNSIDVPFIGIDSFIIDKTLNNYHDWELIDFSRLEEEVLSPFMQSNKNIKYGHFDWGANKIVEKYNIHNHNFLIVEGVGLFRPELLKYFSYTIWIDCPLETAIERGKKRDRDVYHNPQDKKWNGIWKDNDREYLAKCNPKEVANIVIDNG